MEDRYKAADEAFIKGANAQILYDPRQIPRLLNALSIASPKHRISHSIFYLTHKDAEVRARASEIFRSGLREDQRLDLEDLIASPHWKWDLDAFSKFSDLKEFNRHRHLYDRDFYRVATLSNNGFVRATALRELALVPQDLDWPFLLVRLDDWVPQVREIAREAVRRFLLFPAASEIRNWTTLLARESKTVKSENLYTVQLVILHVLKEPNLDQLWRSAGRPFKELTIPYLLNLEEQGLSILESLYRDQEVAVIRELFRSFEKHSAYVKDDLIAIAAMAKNPNIRDFVLESRLKLTPEASTKLLVDALADPSRRVRQTVQFLLAKTDSANIRGQYLSLLQTNPTAAAVEGLGEVGRAEDASLVSTFLINPIPKIRLAAANALVKLGPDPWILQILVDASAKVRRVGTTYVRKNFVSVSKEDRISLFKNPNLGISRTGAELLFCLSKWEAIPWILEALNSVDPFLTKMAQRELVHWLRWSYRSPSIPSAAAFQRAEQKLSDVVFHEQNSELTNLRSFLAWTRDRLPAS